MLRNFLSNALKFTDKGHVLVRVHFPHTGLVFLNPNLQPGNCLGFSVIDTGIGIPEDKRERIFEAFRQADGAMSRKYGGTGLGLSISRGFSEMLGGEIQVESRLGHGSTFTLYLPRVFPEYLKSNAQLEQPKDQRSATNVQDATPNRFTDMSQTILVVDDDSRNLFALKQMLTNHVGTILTAQNGLEALDCLNQRGDVNLVFLDIMMPVMDGYDTMKAIRQQSRFADLPIVILTAKAMGGDREKCLAAGASDYLSKPLDANQLFCTMEKWLPAPNASSPRAPEKEYPLASRASDVPAATKKIDSGTVASISLDLPVTVLVVDDDMRNTFALAGFLQRKVRKVVMARDGIAALAELKRNTEIGIILLAMKMARLSGLEVLAEIRKQPGSRTLPVIALIADGHSEEAEVCMRAGAQDCLEKPVDLETLMKKISTWSTREGDPELPKENPEHAES
ncbi:MAG: response regulator [Magnetococcales bacterium]|nr:response regulator [Magnetococcales bacterium]